MARKVDVRKSIREELGLDTAKEFDSLYIKLKGSHGEIRFVEGKPNLDTVTVGDNHIRYCSDNPTKLMEEMRKEVEKLREEAREHRKTYPMIYRKHPYPNEHLFQ